MERHTLYTPEEQAERERRFLMRKKLSEEGSIDVMIGELEVVVASSDRPTRRYCWKTPDGKIHHSYFWPDEKIGEGKDDPTFYEVSLKYGLDNNLPAGHVWRSKENKVSNKVNRTPDNFEPEE